jgi:hypothetical protein
MIQKILSQVTIEKAVGNRIYSMKDMSTQSTNFNSVLVNGTVSNGYTFRQIPENTKKPVIFTELGWPASGRDDSWKNHD